MFYVCMYVCMCVFLLKDNCFTYGHGKRGRECEMYGKSNMETYIAICKIDSQWEFAIWSKHLLI